MKNTRSGTPRRRRCRRPAPSRAADAEPPAPGAADDSMVDMLSPLTVRAPASPRAGTGGLRDAALQHLQRLEIRVEVEGVVAALAADARDAGAAERRRQVAHQERV